jgi:hypothetical protein
MHDVAIAAQPRIASPAEVQVLIDQRRARAEILGFIAISVPLHVATYFGASMARFSVFPMWYSVLEGAALYPFFLTAVCGLRLADER